MTTQTPPVWLITGCSTGFGREIAKAAIARGFKVVATARDKSAVADLAEGAGDQVLALDLDVTRRDQIKAVVAAAEQKFGRIDVLVNNAGYGYQVSVEEGADADIRKLFEVNVFGVIAVTQAVLPGMRQRRSGYVVNITSTSGHSGLPGSGYYSATKHGIEGWSDALADEGKPIGIKVTCVAPGPFRTDFSGRSLHQSLPSIPEYEDTVGKRLKALKSRYGKQTGDPALAADVIVQLSEMTEPPRHIVLGESGYEAVVEAVRRKLAEIEQWRDLGVATDFPKG